MKSYKIATISGIPLYIHSTFILFFVGAFLATAFRSGITKGLEFLGYVGVVFLLVVLHEFAHILTARRYGIPTKQILLTPIGGMADMEKMPDKPSQELSVAIAGPMSNICLALIAQVLYLLTPYPTLSKALQLFVQINVIFAVFNMLPMFPMDGGRILRALIQIVTSTKKHIATNIAYYAGICICALIIALSIEEKMYMMVIALGFIVLAGYAEMLHERKEVKRHSTKERLDIYIDRYYQATRVEHVIHVLEDLRDDKRLKNSEKCCFLHIIVYRLSEEKNLACDQDKSLQCPCSFYERYIQHAISRYRDAGPFLDLTEELWFLVAQRNGLPIS